MQWLNFNCLKEIISIIIINYYCLLLFNAIRNRNAQCLVGPGHRRVSRRKIIFKIPFFNLFRKNEVLNAEIQYRQKKYNQTIFILK